jgi:NAD(P)-dependent dehydrogenase (short-subunit alcohol dehydrogenase family)
MPWKFKMTSIHELMNLEGRRALITGATGALGSVIVETLAELKSELILVDRPGSDFTSLIDSLRKRWDVQIWHYFCDLEQHEQRIELIELIQSDHTALNILINNAAFVGTSELSGWAVPFEKQTVETWRRAIEVNLTAPFHLCQSFTPILRKSPGSSIINIGSIYGEYGPDWRLYEGTSMANPAAYGASKGGLMQLTQWLATTIAPEVRVNAISPGGIFRNQPDVFVKKYESRTPMGRMANEDDFRGAIAYFASDLSKYVTGQVLAVDGGWGAW